MRTHNTDDSNDETIQCANHTEVRSCKLWLVLEPAPLSIDGKQQPAEFSVFPPELEKEIFFVDSPDLPRCFHSFDACCSPCQGLVSQLVYMLAQGFAVSHKPAHICHTQDRAFCIQDDSYTWDKACHRFPVCAHQSPSTRVTFAQLHVKALCIRPSILLRLTIQLLTACPGLESLAPWIPPQSSTADLVNLLSPLPLTFLSLNITSMVLPSYPKPGLQDHPAFINLTHLDSINNWVLWTQSGPLRSGSSTFLFWPTRSFDFGHVEVSTPRPQRSFEITPNFVCSLLS